MTTLQMIPDWHHCADYLNTVDGIDPVSHALETIEHALWSLLALTRKVTPQKPKKVEDPHNFDWWNYEPYPQLLEEPILLSPGWLEATHEELCLAVADFMLSDRTQQAMQAAICLPDDDVEHPALTLLAQRTLLGRLARLLESEVLDQRLRQVDQVFAVTGRQLMARLDEYEIMQRILITRSPAAGKMSGWQTLEELEDVLDRDQWWGFHAACWIPCPTPDKRGHSPNCRHNIDPEEVLRQALKSIDSD